MRIDNGVQWFGIICVLGFLAYMGKCAMVIQLVIKLKVKAFHMKYDIK